MRIALALFFATLLAACQGLAPNGNFSMRQKEYVFICDSIDKIDEKSWLKNFIGSIKDNGISLDEISEFCADDRDVLFLLPETYGVTSRIFRYQINSRRLVEAQLKNINDHYWYNIDDFVSEKNGVFLLKGEIGDAGCITTQNYQYFYKEDFIQYISSQANCASNI